MVATISIYRMIIFLSENDAQGGSPTHWQTNNDECCEFMLRKFSFNGGCLNFTWNCWQVTKLGSIDLIRKPRCSKRFDCFRTSPHSKNKKITQRTEENGCLFLRKIGPCRHHSSWGQMDSHCGLVLTSLCPEVLRSLVPCRPKTGLHGRFLHHDIAVRTQQQQPWTFSMRERCSYYRTHRTHQTSLPAVLSEDDVTVFWLNLSKDNKYMYRLWFKIIESIVVSNACEVKCKVVWM